MNISDNGIHISSDCKYKTVNMVHSKHFSGIRRMFNKDKNSSHATIPDFLVCETLVQIENQTLAGSKGDGKSTHDLVHECSKLKNINLGQGRVTSNKLGEEVKRSRVKSTSARPPARPSARSSAVVESNTIPGVTSSNKVLMSKTSEQESDIAESTCTRPQAELKSCLKVSSQSVPVKSTSVQEVPPTTNNDERATGNERNENEFLPDWSISYVPLASPAPLHASKKLPVRLLPNRSPIPSRNRLGKSNSDSMVRRVREPVSSQRIVVLNNRTQQSANTNMLSPVLHPCKLERSLLVAHNSAAGSRQVKRTVTEPILTRTLPSCIRRSMSPHSKRVRLNPQPIFYPTYGSVYDRSTYITSPSLTTFEIYRELMWFKINEMACHHTSIRFTNFHLRSVEGAQRAELVDMLKGMVDLPPESAISVPMPAMET